MNVEITLRHLEHTPAIDEKIKSKLQKVAKRLGDDASFHWTAWVEGDQHYSSLQAKSKKHDYFVKAHTDDMYKTMDEVISKIENQIAHDH